MTENWKIFLLVLLAILLALDIWTRLESPGALQQIIENQGRCVRPKESRSKIDTASALDAYIKCRQAAEQNEQGGNPWALFQGSNIWAAFQGLSGVAVACFTYFLMITSRRQWSVGKDQAVAARDQAIAAKDAAEAGKIAAAIATEALRDSRESTVALRRAYVDVLNIDAEQAGTSQQIGGPFRAILAE